MNLLPRSADDPGARRRLIVAAEVLLVVLLVIVNIALWNRSSTPSGEGREGLAGGPTATGTTGPSIRAATTDGATTSAPTSGTPAASRPATSPSPTRAATSASSATASGDRERVVGDVLERARRVIIAVDTSREMGAGLAEVRAALADLVRQAPDGTTVGVLTFSAAGPIVVSPPAPMTAARRDSLIGEITALQPAAAPGRPLYDAMLMGYQHAVTATTINERPLLVVVTGGPRQGGADLQTFVTFMAAERTLHPTVAYPLIVAVGSAVDARALETAAAQGPGRVVRAADAAHVRDALFASLAAAPIPPTETS